MRTPRKNDSGVLIQRFTGCDHSNLVHRLTEKSFDAIRRCETECLLDRELIRVRARSLPVWLSTFCWVRIWRSLSLLLSCLMRCPLG
jgi:hypothetical protein